MYHAISCTHYANAVDLQHPCSTRHYVAAQSQKIHTTDNLDPTDHQLGRAIVQLANGLLTKGIKVFSASECAEKKSRQVSGGLYNRFIAYIILYNVHLRVSR